MKDKIKSHQRKDSTMNILMCWTCTSLSWGNTSFRSYGTVKSMNKTNLECFIKDAIEKAGLSSDDFIVIHSITKLDS